MEDKLRYLISVINKICEFELFDYRVDVAQPTSTSEICAYLKITYNSDDNLLLLRMNAPVNKYNSISSIRDEIIETGIEYLLRNIMLSKPIDKTSKYAENMLKTFADLKDEIIIPFRNNKRYGGETKNT